MVSSSIDGLDFKLFHEQVGQNGADGGTHCCSMNLFKYLPWKRK